MVENPLRRARFVTLGLLAWGAAAVGYLSAVALTWGKPTGAFLATAAGQWRYVVAPTILVWLVIALLIAGGVGFVAAGLSRPSRSEG